MYESFPLQWQAVYRCMVFSLIVRNQDSDKDGSDLEVSGTKSSLNLCIPYSSIYFGLLSSNPNAAPAADTSNNRVSTLDLNPFPAPQKSSRIYINNYIKSISDLTTLCMSFCINEIMEFGIHSYQGNITVTARPYLILKRQL